ncbi:hypothetical protein, partial [Klebsiella michiganensis]|uniref:hypothetical protein n=1 Tax=Klebsiella michiganensis TaxID=1134687 RepID=UPI003969E4D7
NNSFSRTRNKNIQDWIFGIRSFACKLQQNDVTLKMPAFEGVHVQLHQQRDIILSPTICNSAVGSTTGLSGSTIAIMISVISRGRSD